jgi:ADP-ribose pyrophosphatase YjhB (NUDIX family)
MSRTDREYPAHPLPGVLAMVVRDGRVLLVRRGREPDRGKWGFPGGLIEVGETAARAALRELAEETGITAEAGPVLDVFDVVTPDEAGRIRFHYLLVAVACRWLAGEAKAGDDAADVGWFAPAETASLPASGHLARLVALVMAHAAGG